MLIIPGQRRQQRRRYVVGGGLFDWITTTLPSIGRFLSTNKDTISNAAGVIGNVAKAGATTASAVKQIIDIVKAKRATSAQLPKPLEKALSPKSLDFLQQLAHSEGRIAAATSNNNINARIAGAGFKCLKF